MLNNLNISRRLGILIIMSLVVLGLFMAFTLWTLQREDQIAQRLIRSTEQQVQLSWLADTINHKIIEIEHEFHSEEISAQEALAELGDARQQLNNDWNSLFSGLNATEVEFVSETLGAEWQGLQAVIKEFENDLRNPAHTLEEATSEFHEGIDPFMDALSASRAEQVLHAKSLADELEAFGAAAIKNELVLAGLGFTLLALLSAVIARSITRPIGVLSDTVRGIAAGETDRRTELKGTDELNQLGQALDGLLDDRMSTLMSAQEENDELNDSVMELLEGVSDLSDRDLTVSIPVRPDITGTVADAINNMTEQTATVLTLVDEVAADVGDASEAVDQRANTVTKVATAQREVIEETMGMLDNVSSNMEAVSKIAAECNVAAGQASSMTDNAMETVNNTVKGMNEIRDMIQETGKRMKRLGERSNEISEVVDIINAIAERTHVLALNASMQAASAGEAGKGFAVVAEEVQKLAESARDSTAEISSLVRNIQVDTSDTISTMDQTIANVVEGTKLAEAAGQTMTKTRKVTNDLATSVSRIATTSEEQVKVSKGIQEQVTVVVDRTRMTVDHLLGQLKQTKLLRSHSEKLIAAVEMFKLPKRARKEKTAESKDKTSNSKEAA